MHNIWTIFAFPTCYNYIIQLPKEIDDLANPTRGKIQIGLRFMEESKQLLVEVLRCADLAPMDHNGFSDPFVKL